MTPNDVVRKRVVWRRVSLLAKMIQTLQGGPIAESEPRLLPALTALFAHQLGVYRRIVMAPSLLNAVTPSSSGFAEKALPSTNLVMRSAI